MQNTPIPLYERARLNILSMIQHKLSPGDLLPTQEKLSVEFGASLITIKRALRELAQDQIVESIRGRGTVVKKTTVTDVRKGVSSWTDSISGLGERPGTAWITIKRYPPEERVRHLLNLSSTQPVVRVDRLRLVGGKPICLMRNCLPAHIVPDFEKIGMTQESLYQSLRETYGLQFQRASETVRARASTTSEKKYLGKGSSIVLEIERVTEDAKGKPLEWAQVIAHADRYTYQTELINT